MKVAIIIFYYGKVPAYFDLFLQSCVRNRHLDFMFFSDLPLENHKLFTADNISKVYFTCNEFRALVKERIGFIVPSNFSAYKFTDFKPAYGHLMSKWIDGYDYWGFCDVDMILSNTQLHFEKTLGKYDIINTYNKWIHGPLCVIRNLKKLNELFLKSEDVKKVFETNQHYAFDEKGKKNNIRQLKLERSSDFTSLPKEIFHQPFESFTDVVYKNKDSIKLYCEDSIVSWLGNPPHKIVIKNSELLFDGIVPIFAYHFVWEKT